MKTVYLIGISFLIGSGAMFALKSCNKKEVASIRQIAAHQDDSSRYYRDLWGAEHAERLLIVGKAKDIELFHKHTIDSLCKRLSIRERQINDMMEVYAEESSEFIAPTQQATIHDTIPGEPIGWTGQVFNWKDSFLTVYGFVDSVQTKVYYDIKMPINITTYWKRKWFLGKKRYYIDGFSTNNKVHLSGLSGININ